MTEATMQREFFGYLTLVNDFDGQIERYWDKNEKRIASWYLAQKRPDGLIISASPNCVIEPIANRLGVRFTPWFHGNRCPFEDSNAGGMFFNIRIENNKEDLLRAVMEGVCYHLRWLLEYVMRKVKTSDAIRFVGGGSLSPVICQVLADITGRPIETVDNPQSAGAAGAALAVAANLRGEDVAALSKTLIRANHRYQPNPGNREIYERNYRVFKRLYKNNAASFRQISEMIRQG